jgi:hypothetical protein
MGMRSLPFGLVAAGLLMTGCARRAGEPAQKPIPTEAPKSLVESNFQTSWQDETQYIVTAVATDLSGMFYFARHGEAVKPGRLEIAVTEEPVADGLAYRIRIKQGLDREVTCRVPITSAVWAPATYKPLVIALSGAYLAGTRNKLIPNSASLETLAWPRAEEIAAFDTELSGQLARNFRSDALHDQAALLIGAFALREASGVFYQIRSELCRMTAHLAFAESLRAGAAPTEAGRVAGATLTTLYNDQVTALAQISGIPDNPATGPWKRALRMRVTGDYRIIGESAVPTLLERREWFRARGHAISFDKLWDELKPDDELRKMADSARISNEDNNHVGLGSVLLEVSRPLELEECTLVYAMENGHPMENADLVNELNREPDPCVSAGPGGAARIQVLGGADGPHFSSATSVTRSTPTLSLSMTCGACRSGQNFIERSPTLFSGDCASIPSFAAPMRPTRPTTIRPRTTRSPSCANTRRISPRGRGPTSTTASRSASSTSRRPAPSSANGTNITRPRARPTTRGPG